MSPGNNQHGDRILDLSDLFAPKRKIKVKYPGPEGEELFFELLDPGDLAPRDFAKLNHVMAQAAKLEEVGKDADQMEEPDFEALDQLYNDAIALLSPDMGELEIPFMAKVRIIGFYNEQIKSSPLIGDQSKKAPEPEGEGVD